MPEEIEDLKRGDILISPKNKKVFIFLEREKENVVRFPGTRNWESFYYYALWDVREAKRISVTADDYRIYFRSDQYV